MCFLAVQFSREKLGPLSKRTKKHSLEQKHSFFLPISVRSVVSGFLTTEQEECTEKEIIYGAELISKDQKDAVRMAKCLRRRVFP